MNTFNKKYNSYCQEFLVGEFARRQARNSTYSIRAFSRDIGISKTTVSEVINGLRRLSPNNVEILCKVLKLDKKTEQQLLMDFSDHENAGRSIFSTEDFALIKDWHYLAILNLAKLKKNKFDPQWVANRLGIELELAQKSLEDLMRMHLIENKNGRLFRTIMPITVNSTISSEALRSHHVQSINKAIDSFEKVPVELRNFTTVTYVLHPEKIPKVQDLIHAFHRKLGKILPVKNATDVYRLNIQFFPLTDVQNKAGEL